MPFSFWQGIWSDPIGFVAGSLPAKPTSITSGNTPRLQAASLDGVADHAVLVSGKWPGQLSASAGGAIPAALPANTAALLKLRPGDVLRVQDQDTGAHQTFILTGLLPSTPPVTPSLSPAPRGSRRWRPGCWRRPARRGRPSPSWCPRKPRRS